MNLHPGFTTTKAGLVVSLEQPSLAASPDGYIKCKCHGIGVIEVKCYRNATEMKKCQTSLTLAMIFTCFITLKIRNTILLSKLIIRTTTRYNSKWWSPGYCNYAPSIESNSQPFISNNSSLYTCCTEVHENGAVVTCSNVDCLVGTYHKLCVKPPRKRLVQHGYVNPVQIFWKNRKKEAFQRRTENNQIYTK
jgi:hypothetical protein